MSQLRAQHVGEVSPSPGGPPRKATLIYNPISGMGFARKKIAALTRGLQRCGFAVELAQTQRRGDAKRLSSSLRDDCSLLVVVGGDGTLNEVINGLRPQSPPIAVVPSGTANVLAKELDLPKRTAGICQMFSCSRSRELDLATVGGRRFLLLASVGFDAQVALVLSSERKGRIGIHSYIGPIIRTLLRYRSPRLHIEIDRGRTSRVGSLVIISNVSSYGGPLQVAPNAVPDDGMLDICVFKGTTRSDIFRYFWGAYWRRISLFDDVEYIRAREVTVTANRPVPIQVDGDFAGWTPATFHLEKWGVKFIVPDVTPTGKRRNASQ